MSAILNRKPERFLVIGTHRADGGLYVWCGAEGFQSFQSVIVRGMAGQLVNHRTAEELIAHIQNTSSTRRFDITILPVLDLTMRDAPFLLHRGG